MYQTDFNRFSFDPYRGADLRTAWCALVPDLESNHGKISLSHAWVDWKLDWRVLMANVFFSCNEHICHDQITWRVFRKNNSSKIFIFFNRIVSTGSSCKRPNNDQIHYPVVIQWSSLVAFRGKGGQTFLIHWWSWCSLTKSKFRLWKKVILFIGW